MIKIRSNIGSLMVEYTMLVVIIVAALLCAQIYVKRALCGRWRKSADFFGQGRQYEPNETVIR
ncbi:MAG: hypothetical protein JW869_06165 [Candidatus Omnitrophica bacterium]|nr:hypothetical protein [Candidatus Omnitrophota bacterium]